MRKLFLPLVIVLLMVSIAGCSPTFDSEAEEHLWNGIEYVRQGNDTLAMQEFTTAIELDPQYYYAYYNRALVYYRNHEFENSLKDYNKAIELGPENVYWIIERGFLLKMMGQPDSAIIDLEKAQELGIPFEYKVSVEKAISQLKRTMAMSGKQTDYPTPIE